MNAQQCDDKEYYPRLKRAPYIYDGSDFVRPTRALLGSVETDVPLNDEGDNPSGLNRTPHKSSSNLQQSPAMGRRGSLLRVFSSSLFSPVPIAEGTSLEPQDGETNPLLLLSRTRRGSSVDVANARERDRLNSRDLNAKHNYPPWALHDPASIVMNNGFPVTVGTLIQHHLLLNKSPQQLSHHYIVTPTWRLKERMKTVGVALVLALNIGTDPPGLIKPSPCAKLQCWLDPTSVSRAKAKERIGERLEQQYAKWQQRSKLKYRRAIDPTVDVVKDLCLRMRDSAKNERVLFHYNGHGVPRPTANGEIWLFDRHHTNYIPLSVTDLRRWIGKPSIVVLDCSGAGQLMPYFTSPVDGDFSTAPFHHGSSATMDNSDPSDPLEPEYQAIRDTIVLCPTSQGEWLPLNPELPADLFTSCLTTPIPVALRWFVHQNPLSMEKIDLETIADAIPGKLTERKTPLGELNWIFTAVTDTIAWNVLPSQLFQRLFRQDLLVASMFRNFLLAERILRSLNCTPMTNPEIPSTCNHPLWDAWDLAVETCLHQLIDQGYLRKTPSSSAPASEEGDDNTNNIAAHEPEPVAITAPTTDSPFFGEQLTAFEIWLEYANTKPKSKLVIRSPPSAGTPLPYLWGENSKPSNQHEMDPPVELPIVLQVLLSQAHRVRALVLLKRFLELGPSAGTSSILVENIRGLQ
jgi:regulator-associated protein of mTOR